MIFKREKGFSWERGEVGVCFLQYVIEFAEFSVPTVNFPFFIGSLLDRDHKVGGRFAALQKFFVARDC